MGKTFAQVLEERGIERGIEKGIEEGIEKGIERGIEKGKLTSRRETLLRQLRRRFGRLPDELVETIERTDDLDQLDTWLDRVVSAKNLDEMRIRDSR